MSTAVSAKNDFGALVKRAEKGDKQAAAAMLDYLDAHPEFCDRIGNVAGHVEAHLVSFRLPKGAQEATFRKLATMRTELAGPSPTPLDRLLAERVVACWFESYYADSLLAQMMKEGGRSVVSLDFYQRYQDRAHWRYLSALRTLAQVRRLGMPPVQVNIGKQQVNVAKSD